MKNVVLFFLFCSASTLGSAITEVSDQKLFVDQSPALRLASLDLTAKVETFSEQVAYSFLPRYPAELRREGVAGAATIDLVVDPAGAVTSAAVLHASHRAFGFEALDAVRQWRFVPGSDVGEPGPRQIQVSVRFILVGNM